MYVASKMHTVSLCFVVVNVNYVAHFRVTSLALELNSKAPWRIWVGDSNASIQNEPQNYNDAAIFHEYIVWFYKLEIVFTGMGFPL